MNVGEHQNPRRRAEGVSCDGPGTAPAAPGRAYEDEALAPAVDRPLLLALARGELSEPDARAVYRLIAAFKSWSDAHAEAVVEAFRGRKPG